MFLPAIPKPKRHANNEISLWDPPCRTILGSVKKQGNRWVPLLQDGSLAGPVGLLKESMDILVEYLRSRSLHGWYDQLHQIATRERIVYVVPTVRESCLESLKWMVLTFEGVLEFKWGEPPQSWLRALSTAVISNPEMLVVDCAGLNHEQTDCLLRAIRGWRKDFAGTVAVFLPEYPWWVQNMEQHSHNRLIHINL